MVQMSHLTKLLALLLLITSTAAVAQDAAAPVASPSPNRAFRYQTLMRRLESGAIVSGTVSSAPAAAASQPETAEQPVDQSFEFKRDALVRATAFVQQGDSTRAMAVVDEVGKKLGASDPFVDELQGTVLTLKKDYAAAEKSFRTLLLKLPDSSVAQFNLAEVIFLQRHYDTAEQSFAQLESKMREIDPAL